MHVVATAGHVDHGKSSLVQRLTGQDPDRLPLEKRRGLTIELGYCWTAWDPVGEVAFVDVPGHERFISTMLSGIGSVPAALFVAAADDPWMPQAAEHLAALDALGITHAVFAVTRSDLADPAATVERARHEVARTSMAGSAVVPVSARTGAGIAELKDALATMLGTLDPPDVAADVRLWVDRHFTVRGAGTVATGTLPAGQVRVGDTLQVGPGRVRVRSLQTLGRPVVSATGPARVALNLSGADSQKLHRGDPLLTPGAWHLTTTLDVRLIQCLVPGMEVNAQPPTRPLLRIGAASTMVHFRPLDDDHARRALDRPLPLHIGDRALLRDPGTRRLWGVMVLDPAPPALARRGARARRAAVVRDIVVPVSVEAEVDRRGIVNAALLSRIGVKESAAPVNKPGEHWLMSSAEIIQARTQLIELISDHQHNNPLSPGLAVGVAAQRLGLPSHDLIHIIVASPLRVHGGLVLAQHDRVLPPPVERAVRVLEKQLADDQFDAPNAETLRALGMDAKALAAVASSGRLLRVSPSIVLLPGAEQEAVRRLAELPTPFTVSQARAAFGTTRRVALPLLEYLDKQGFTRRIDGETREVRARE